MMARLLRAKHAPQHVLRALDNRVHALHHLIEFAHHAMPPITPLDQPFLVNLVLPPAPLELANPKLAS